MPEFEVEVKADYEHLTELCTKYWTTNEDGSFTYTVKALADLFDQPSHKISKIVADACFVRSASRRCSECNKGFIYRSRTDWISGARFGPSRCQTCIEAERRRRAEQREQANAAMRATILERYAVVADGPTPCAENLDMPAAFALAGLFEDGEELSLETTVPVVDRTDRLTPTLDYDFQLLSLLADLRLVRLHPYSSLDSVVWKEDGSLDGAYYPTLASYYLPGTGTLGARVDEYLKTFAQITSRETWPDRWVDQFSEFWFDMPCRNAKHIWFTCFSDTA